MKMQFVFGNPHKKSSFPKHGNALKSKGKVKGLLERLKMSKKDNPYNKPKDRKKLEKLMYQDLKGIVKRSESAKKAQEKKKLKKENKALKKAVRDLEQLEMELLDSSIKEKDMAKKKGPRKSAPKKSPKSTKSTRSAAAKKAARTRKRNLAKKQAEKDKKKSSPKKASPKKSPSKSARRSAAAKKAARTRKRNAAKKAVTKKAKSKRSSRSKRKPIYKYSKGYRLTYKKVRDSQKGKPHYRKNKKGSIKYMWKRNPLGGSMSKLEKFTGMSMPEAGGLLVGGLAYGAVNSILSKIPVVKNVHSQLLKVPVVGSALPTLVAGALMNFLGDKYKVKAVSMLGKGLVGAAVVGMGVNASQMIPGLKGMSGVDLTMGEGQLGLNEADFGEDNPADFGELIQYNDQAYSGVDFTMGGVDFTMGEDNPADFGELIEMNEQALSGGQLG